MKNNLFPLLTQKMVDENPSLSGQFRIEEKGIQLVAIDRFEINCFIFLKQGKPYNENGPCVIGFNLRVIFYVGHPMYKNHAMVGISYESRGKMQGSNFILPTYKKCDTHYYDEQANLHNASGPANALISSDGKGMLSNYWIHGKGLSKENWEKHPEVLEYQAKINLKKKMQKTFKKDN